MHSDQTFVDLVGLIYDAAANPKLWTPFLERIQDVLRAEWGFFHVHDFSCRKVDIMAEVGFDPAYRRAYQEYYASKNVVLIHGRRSLQSGDACLTRMLCSDDVLLRTSFTTSGRLPRGSCTGSSQRF
jgi:hypothetical protein